MGGRRDSPSPPSSPLLTDSSPPSSPCIDADPPSLQHPLAASAKSNWHPPLYEKKRVNVSSFGPEPLPLQKKVRYGERECLTYNTRPSTIRTPQQIESESWEEASAKVVDGGHGLVNLDERNLTAIPQNFIDDLAKFYIPPKSSEMFSSIPKPTTSHRNVFNRVATDPPGSTSTTRPFTHTLSTANASFGVPRESLQLFLVSNRISFLPPALFTLQSLTVLSLRNNLITHIPPEIACLKNLTSLSIGGNRITFLPSEIMKMSLKQFQVIPNPFLEPPQEESSDGKRPFLRSSTLSRLSLQNKGAQQRLLSEAEHTLPRVLSLVEISLRSLLSSAGACHSADTNLQAYYNLPLDEREHGYIPSHLRMVLGTCVPQSIFRGGDSIDTPMDGTWWSNITGIGSCPSPRHDTRHLYIQHAEERFSWEQTIASVDLGELVPVRWRGCQWGCLDYLDGKGDAVEGHGEHYSDAVLGTEGIPGGETAMEDVVKIVQFDGIYGLDEFD